MSSICHHSLKFSILIAKPRWCLSPWKTTVLPRLHFKVPSKSTQLPLGKTSPFKKIWTSALSKNYCDFEQQEHGMISGGSFTSCSFNLNLNKLHATAFTELLRDNSNLNSIFARSALTWIVEDCQFLWNLQSLFARAAIFVKTVSFMQKLCMEMRHPAVVGRMPINVNGCVGRN